MSITTKFFSFLTHPKRTFNKLIRGKGKDPFLMRDKEAWDRAGYLHPEREGSMRGMMIFHAHCVEKGLTMPRFEPGHGTGRILELCDTMEKYKKAGFDRKVFEYRTALSAMAGYQHVHHELGYTLPEKVSAALHSILDGENAVPDRQLDMTPQLLWQHTEAAFPAFSASRHSVRHFAGAAPQKDLMAAVNLAANAPSACNKQYVRVHLYEGRDKVQPLLALQNGNAGFGDTAEQLILVTSDMSYMHWRGERHEIYLCAGLFAMNLSYALHYYHVGHCMLNWQVTPQKDKEMRTLAGIPDCEEIALVIICGRPANTFRATSSPRRKGEDITTLH